MSDRYLRYAEEIAILGGLKAPALKSALATVRRDRFLPPGPWVIESLEGLYYTSESDDVGQILHGVGVALDPARLLNNANPVKISVQLQLIDLKPGERVFHVGAGTGYFTALMAELVGPGGQVTAAEIHPPLHEQARHNLAPWPWVRVIGDALAQPPAAVDVIFSSCGLADIPQSWIDRLAQGGRMVLPITGNHDHGAIFILRKLSANGPLAASVQSFTRHFPCLGSRDERAVAALSAAFARPVSQVASLRLDDHDPDDSCWLHGDHWCLSTRAP